MDSAAASNGWRPQRIAAVERADGAGLGQEIHASGRAPCQCWGRLQAGRGEVETRRKRGDMALARVGARVSGAVAAG